MIKAKIKKKQNLFLMVLGILLLSYTLIYHNFNDNPKSKQYNLEKLELEKGANLKVLEYWLDESPIYINESESGYNWNTFNSTHEFCNGLGTWDDPYVIENVTINNAGGSGITIADSNVYFEIRNCTIFSSLLWGIRLVNVNNSRILDNNCSNNRYDGISLEYSNNNTIVGNFIDRNEKTGISISVAGSSFEKKYCRYNNISENSIYSNDGHGIWMSALGQDSAENYLNNNTIARNTVYNNTDGGIMLGAWWFSTTSIANVFNNTISHNNVTENEHYGIYLYYSFSNEVLDNNASNNKWDGIFLAGSVQNILKGNIADNNTYHGFFFMDNSDNNIIKGNNLTKNEDGMILWESDHNLISGNNMSLNSNWGISVDRSHSNNITYNTINNNSIGIYLYRANYNNVSENSLKGNDMCILDVYGIRNTYKNNTCKPIIIPLDNGDDDDDDDKKDEIIFGYDIFILIGLTFTLVSLIYIKLVRKRLK